MNNREILARVDHTVLAPQATTEDIRRCLEEAVQYGCASVCIPPSYVGFANDWKLENEVNIPICTVIGFPLGYHTTASKVIELVGVKNEGADEFDVVIPIGKLKEGNTEEIYQELLALRTAAADNILKVIIETALLTEEEKITMCGLVSEVGADYIKTSTGFAKGGATLEDIHLFKQHIGPKVKIKAAGGIRTKEEMIQYLEAGADRLGCSSAVSVLGEDAATS